MQFVLQHERKKLLLFSIQHLNGKNANQRTRSRIRRSTKRKETDQQQKNDEREKNDGKCADKKELLFVTASTITGMCYNCYSKLIKTISRIEWNRAEMKYETRSFKQCFIHYDAHLFK